MLEFFGVELRAFATSPRDEESRRPSFPIELGCPLDGHQRHTERLGHVALRRAALHDELTGEKPEAGQIAFRMGKDRQVPIEINHLLAFHPTGKLTIDLHTASRKNGKLHLWHPLLLCPPRP